MQLCEAANGEEGLAAAAREKPDLIILDVTMPVMDGVTMLTKLKEDPELKTIPVIMLTAESGRDNVLQIARLGVRDYLVKPFKEDQLIEKAGRIVTLQKKPGRRDIVAYELTAPIIRNWPGATASPPSWKAPRA